jgi:hypothetical protein
MQYNHMKQLDAYVPEHVQPVLTDPLELKSAIDAANIDMMWDMILTLDYGVSDPDDLSREKRDEFLNIMSLLLKAYDR